MTPSCSVVSQYIMSNQTSLVMLWLLEYNDKFEHSTAYSPLRPSSLYLRPEGIRTLLISTP